MRDEQRKFIKYNHLLANLMAFHNVVTMTKAIQGAEADGHPVSDEVLASLSPFPTEHINRFGKHVLNFSRNPEPVVLDFRKASGRETSILTQSGIRKTGDTRTGGGSGGNSARIVLAVEYYKQRNRNPEAVRLSPVVASVQRRCSPKERLNKSGAMLRRLGTA